jgi:hypothetical protein
VLTETDRYLLRMYVWTSVEARNYEEIGYLGYVASRVDTIEKGICFEGPKMNRDRIKRHIVMCDELIADFDREMPDRRLRRAALCIARRRAIESCALAKEALK